MSESAEEDALTAYIREIVDRAPPLSDEQRDKLALLLRPVTPVPPRPV